jgi:phage tail-like protein
MTPPDGGQVALEPAFSVLIGQTLLGTFTECSGLAAEYETYSYAEGGNNLFVHTLRGRLRHPVVTLKGGVTDHSVLLDWALGSPKSLLLGCEDVRVTFHDPLGKPLRVFHLLSATPVKWTGPTGSATANAVATESLEIAHQGLAQ